MMGEEVVFREDVLFLLGLLVFMWSWTIFNIILTNTTLLNHLLPQPPPHPKPRRLLYRQLRPNIRLQILLTLLSPFVIQTIIINQLLTIMTYTLI